MLFKQKKSERKVVIKSDVKDGIISYCKMTHPDEMVLILKGKSKNSVMNIDGLVIPPFSHTGSTFAGFPSSFLPLDMSYIGMVHSHPTGSEEPSIEDLNDFFGLVSIIIKSPYNEDDMFAWDSSGNSIPLSFSD
ncbi:MAG TPA: Mov34/MPN/PAD-1 family protein [Candidatus Nitrosopelagicus sp.]|jgi:proteasome lid subunit RPN8/RPN11|nr:Mov34/MPN/PAD-1 family protein [Candidatus Nitrosopelagicus sp.]|tara:strand:- start:762 stop:1163 length:402 start_codon:yes stop_codon:yes gene_type:complete